MATLCLIYILFFSVLAFAQLARSTFKVRVKLINVTEELLSLIPGFIASEVFLSSFLVQL